MHGLCPLFQRKKVIHVQELKLDPSVNFVVMGLYRRYGVDHFCLLELVSDH
jgi:hypothetical protein